MKSFTVRFFLWLFLDVCVALTSWILFVALIVGSGSGSELLSFGWLAFCGFLLLIMVARIIYAGRFYYGSKEVAEGWRILAFLLHLLALLGGIYITCLLSITLLGAGASAGEPMG